MKQAIALALLILFIFYVGGYYPVFVTLKRQSDRQLNLLFDAGRLDRESTHVIKVPLSLPYPVYYNGFERANVEFELNGAFYKLVKHTYENDTLFLVCYKDEHTSRLTAALKDLVSFSTDLPASSKIPPAFSSKKIADYEPIGTIRPEPVSSGWQQLLQRGYCITTPVYPFLQVAEPPPRKQG